MNSLITHHALLRLWSLHTAPLVRPSGGPPLRALCLPFRSWAESWLQVEVTGEAPARDGVAAAGEMTGERHRPRVKVAGV